MNSGEPVRVINTQPYSLGLLKITPDGKSIVAASQVVIRVYDLASGTPRWSLWGHTHEIRGLAVTSDGQHIVSGSVDGWVFAWNMSDGSQVLKYQNSGSLLGLTLTPDNALIITCAGQLGSDAIYISRFHDGSLVRTCHSHASSVCCIAVSPNGLYIVSGALDCRVHVHTLDDGVLRNDILHSGFVSSVAVTLDSLQIITGCTDGKVRVFNLSTGSPLRELTNLPLNGFRLQLTISSDGRHVAFPGHIAHVLNVVNCAAKPLVYATRSAGIAFHPNNKQVITSTDDAKLCFWTICQWSDRDHQLFGSKFKALVFYLMCVKARLDALTDKKDCILPRLPMAVWLQVFVFLA